MLKVYYNLKSYAGRETVDELCRQDFPQGTEGFKNFRKEKQRIWEEYLRAGMNVYLSSRPCANWH